jgi:hypothetical protein
VLYAHRFTKDRCCHVSLYCTFIYLTASTVKHFLHCRAHCNQYRCVYVSHKINMKMSSRIGPGPPLFKWSICFYLVGLFTFTTYIWPYFGQAFLRQGRPGSLTSTVTLARPPSASQKCVPEYQQWAQGSVLLLAVMMLYGRET